MWEDPLPRLRPGGRGSRGRFLRGHPPTSGVRGPGLARERPERAPSLGGQTGGVRGPGSPLGWRWLEVGAVLAGETGAGGERGPCTPQGAVSTGWILPRAEGPCSRRGWCLPRGHRWCRGCASPSGRAGIWFSLAPRTRCPRGRESGG